MRTVAWMAAPLLLVLGACQQPGEGGRMGEDEQGVDVEGGPFEEGGSRDEEAESIGGASAGGGQADGMVDLQGGDTAL